MSNKFRTGTLAFAIAAALGTTQAYAAEDSAKNRAKDKDVEKIVVVGSRAAPRSIADSPVPVDLIGGDELSRSGSSDMLDQVAAAVPSFNVRAQPISDAATLIRPVNLRGLSSDSTLVLVNGKRRHRASVIAFQGGGVNDGAQGPDISVIPSVALKQVEVLRDGAAAQYGSDAIAGVMNFVLKDDADGGSLSVKTGEFYAGDGASTVIDGNIGMPFTDDGFANFSFQYKNADATSRSVQRPDAAELAKTGTQGIQNPAQIWGNPEINNDITIFGNIGLDLGNDKEFYMFGNYSERDVEGGFYYRNPENRRSVYGNTYATEDTDGNGVINSDDDASRVTWLVGDLTADSSGNCPIVDYSLSERLTDQPGYQTVMANDNCWAFNKIFPGGYTPRFGGNIVDTALTAGTKGEIKGGMFDEALYDLSASVGRNASTFYLRNTVNPSLGPNQPIGNKFQTGEYIELEKTFNADIVKAVDVGLEEEMSIAGGLEWREESFQIISGDKASWEAGPLADQGFSIGSHGFKGFGPESQGTNTRRSVAAYIDTETYFTDDFMIGAALRYENFTSFGDTLNFKLSSQYSLTEELSVRGAVSTGFRAPTVGQANVVNTQTSIVNGDLIQTFTAPPTDPLSAFYGGKELDPEKSTNYSFGTVYENNGFYFTADYYHIKVKDRITQSSQIAVRPQDYDQLRALGVQNPELISAVTYFANDFSTTTQGLDVVANYGMELMNGDTQFSLAYNWNDTKVDKFNPETTSLGKVHRLEDGIPHHRATFTISQSWEDLSAFIRTNYYGTYYATHADDTTDWGSQNADSAITLDAEVSYFVNESITLTVGANNLLDQKAQRLKDSAYGVLGAKYYESGPFDYNGGYYYVKATYNF